MKISFYKVIEHFDILPAITIAKGDFGQGSLVVYISWLKWTCEIWLKHL